MLNKYSEEVKLLVEWYIRAKKVAIIAESMDPENTSYLQPLHELRYCLDHFVRAIVYEKKDVGKDEVIKAINSAIGHLQRAYADSIEWLLISVKDEYLNVLGEYTTSQIRECFPEYHSEIIGELDKITDIVNEYKDNKSVEEASDTDIISDDELKFLKKITKQFIDDDVVKKLKDYRDMLHSRQAALIDVKIRDKKEDRVKLVYLPIIIGVVCAVVGGALSYFIFGC